MVLVVHVNFFGVFLWGICICIWRTWVSVTPISITSVNNVPCPIVIVPNIITQKKVKCMYVGKCYTYDHNKCKQYTLSNCHCV